MRSYLVDTSSIEWTPGETGGLTFRCQVLLDGADGGPEAIRFRFDPTPSVYAHMHLTSQFQMVLGGEMHMPRGMDLARLDVHYTDHCVPYGPFAVDHGHDMLVLHPGRGGLISMADPEARASINLDGRLLIGSPRASEWSTAAGSPVRTKPIIRSGGPDGPDVSMVALPPNSAVVLAPAPFGRYEVVIEGELVSGSRRLVADGLRYVEGDDVPSPIITGPDGATLMLLAFGPDARLGGLQAYGFGDRAEQTLAMAI